MSDATYTATSAEPVLADGTAEMHRPVERSSGSSSHRWRTFAVVASTLLVLSFVALSAIAPAQLALDMRGVVTKALVGDARLQWTDWAHRCLTVERSSNSNVFHGARVLLSECKPGTAEQAFVSHAGMLEWESQRSLCITMGAKSGDSYPLLMYPCDYHNRGQFFSAGRTSSRDPLRPEALEGACVSGNTPADYAQALVMPCLYDPTLGDESVLQGKRRLRAAHVDA